MQRLMDAEIATLDAMIAAFVPIFYSGKGYEQDSVKAIDLDGEIALTVENPWAGNTGYGMKGTIRLDAQAARDLGLWLLAASLRKH